MDIENQMSTNSENPFTCNFLLYACPLCSSITFFGIGDNGEWYYKKHCYLNDIIIHDAFD